MFALYGSVIVMNFIVALMVNQLHISDAESLLYAKKVYEISRNIHLKDWKEMFCGSNNTSQNVAEYNKEESVTFYQKECKLYKSSLMDVDMNAKEGFFLKQIGKIGIRPIPKYEAKIDCKNQLESSIGVFKPFLGVSNSLMIKTKERLRHKNEEYDQMVRENKTIQWEGNEKVMQYI